MRHTCLLIHSQTPVIVFLSHFVIVPLSRINVYWIQVLNTTDVYVTVSAQDVKRTRAAYVAGTEPPTSDVSLHKLTRKLSQQEIGTVLARNTCKIASPSVNIRFKYLNPITT